MRSPGCDRVLGGIVAPWLFGQLMQIGDRGRITLGYDIAAASMIMGAAPDLGLGFKSERMPLEKVAPPIALRTAPQLFTLSFDT